MTPLAKPPLSSFWLVIWACALSFAWLLPNHYPPWAAFHADAWVAAALALVSVAVIWRVQLPTQWHASTVLVTLLACIPLLQYGVGLISFAGQAWMSTAYLLGLLLALLIGQRWEQACAGQLMDGLFLAIGIASVASISLQLQTWLGLMDSGIFDLWTMGLSGSRPYANFGQPNQLASFLLWGLLACAWAYSNQKIGAPVAILATSYLLLGIALTQSRTAWLGLTLIVLATWFWRRLWRSRWLPWTVTGLFILFWLLPPFLKALTDVLLLASEQTYFRDSMQGELRPLAWKVFIEAAFNRPWFGYGWSDVAHAQFAVASDLPPLHEPFAHAHNLFLDLTLWLGIPLGLFVIAALVWQFMAYVRAVTHAKDAILCMFLGVIGIHAMLELPLHYAYFLLPSGMVAGVLNSRIGSKPIWQTPRWTLTVLWLAATVLLSRITVDYFRVEASYQATRFELAHIGKLPPGKPPDVVLLTHLRERINFMRFKVKAGMSSDELRWMRQVGTAFPDALSLYRVATALALNGQPVEARQWLASACKVTSSENCDVLHQMWARDTQVDLPAGEISRRQ